LGHLFNLKSGSDETRAIEIRGVNNNFQQTSRETYDPAEADILSAVQKPFNQSISTEKSGPPA
jgi:hypothetical protein